MDDNPYISVYTRLADVLQETARLQEIVKPGNFIRYDVEPGQADAWQSGDMPLLELVWVPGAPRNVNQTSSSGRLDLQFSLLWHTDVDVLSDPRQGLAVMDVDWAITRALFQAGTTLDNQYIVRWDITSFTPVEPDESENNAMARGWSAEMMILVETRIKHQLLRS